MGCENTRITIDLDTRSRIHLKWALLKGRFLFGRTADEIYRTNRGFHCIWFNIPCSEEQMYRYREIIGDDKKRISLDRGCEFKPKQVLFSEKKSTYYDSEGNIRHEEIHKRERVR